MWNFFRLENEHLNNCGQYVKHLSHARSTHIKPPKRTDVPVAPS